MPRRLRDLVRLLKNSPVTIEQPPGGGSHWRWRHADGRSLTVPAGNGYRTEIADHYIRQLAAFVGVEYQWLRTAKK